MIYRARLLFVISSFVALGGTVNPAAAQSTRSTARTRPAGEQGVPVVQVASTRPAALEADSAWRSTTGAMRNDLRYLAVAQEIYRINHGTYADDVRKLAYAPSSDVAVKLLRSDSAGWSAAARHKRLKGGSCVIYVGFQNSQLLPHTQRESRTGEEWEPVCDAPAAR
jgi:hypothetical protein